MAQLSTYTDANKVESSRLAVRYTFTYGTGRNGSTTVHYYTVKRTAKKSYAYVGMTRAAANACAAAKIAQYTRQLLILGDAVAGVPSVDYETVCVADVAAVHDHDGSWSCQISVNETDSICTTEIPIDGASYFKTYVASRTYDETLDAPVLNGVIPVLRDDGYHTRLWVDENQYQLREFVVQRKTSSQADWTNCTVNYGLSSTVYIIVDEIVQAGEIYRVIVRNRVSNAKMYNGGNT